MKMWQTRRPRSSVKKSHAKAWERLSMGACSAGSKNVKTFFHSHLHEFSSSGNRITKLEREEFQRQNVVERNQTSVLQIRLRRDDYINAYFRFDYLILRSNEDKLESLTHRQVINIDISVLHSFLSFFKFFLHRFLVSINIRVNDDACMLFL